jgi:hypothetical protein
MRAAITARQSHRLTSGGKAVNNQAPLFGCSSAALCLCGLFLESSKWYRIRKAARFALGDRVFKEDSNRRDPEDADITQRMVAARESKLKLGLVRSWSNDMRGAPGKAIIATTRLFILGDLNELESNLVCDTTD